MRISQNQTVHEKIIVKNVQDESYNKSHHHMVCHKIRLRIPLVKISSSWEAIDYLERKKTHLMEECQ